MGFGELEVIDLDTIEVSNLNRQFLFDKDSVGKPKSQVARETVLKFNPNINIKAHYADIMDQKFGSAFYNKFKLVINALDNKKARFHVNRMCLSADIPFLDSGTMGFSGQVEFIKKGESMCYECLSKPEPKSYPMCTIRNTPKEPIHCIVWSKYLFGQLFGECEEDVSMEVTTQNNPLKMSAREWAVNNDYDPKKLFSKIFITDIHYLLAMPVLFVNKIRSPITLSDKLTYTRTEYKHEPDNKILKLEQYVTMFMDCVDSIKERFKTNVKCLIWDKDDDIFMNFVVASSNIRSYIFHIPFQSQFDIKSMAGNIIPAVATANAIVAGQIVIHSLRVLKGEYKKCQNVFLRELPNHRGTIMVKDKFLQPPNPKCSACSTEGQIVLSTDFNKFTLLDLEQTVLIKKLSMVAPDVIFNGSVYISSDVEDKLDLSKPLQHMGLQNGSRISADDYFQNYGIKIVLYHKEKEKEEDPDFEVFASLQELQEKARKAKDIICYKEIQDDDNADCIMQAVINTVDNKTINKHIDLDINEHKIENMVTVINEDVTVVKEDENNKEDKVILTKEDEVNQEDMELDSPEDKSNKEDKVIVSKKDEEIKEDMIITQKGEEHNNDMVIIANKDEVSNEEILAIKRKAENEENISDSKKSRVD